jgi:glycosyltransferase involved in cell wall biosynthesis
MEGEARGRDGRGLVSVVVPSFRGADRLPSLLAAFRAQTTTRTWELIVVVDGRVDDSAAVLRRHGHELPLRVIELEENGGRCGALNTGFAQAVGEVLVRCDDDLRPRPEYIERHAAWHDTATDIGVVGLTRNVFRGGRYATVYGRHSDELYRRRAYANPAGKRWLHWAANCSVHRTMWERVGPYAPSFASYGEDLEWGRRLIGAGGRIVLDPALEVDHLNPVHSAEIRFQRAFYAQSVTARIESTYGDPPSTDFSARIKDRVWSGLVRLGSRGASAETYRGRGRSVDRIAPVLPAALARRLVAWGIEAAGEAGRRHGQSLPR